MKALGVSYPLNHTGQPTMATVAVSLALGWRWRCETEGTIFSGSDLRVVDPQRDFMVPLGEVRHTSEVVRERLRHTCGGRVTPIAPLSLL
jgi:hypothetical protein